ncbi:hypothetical protein D3C84_998260 [compost metagenome]
MSVHLDEALDAAALLAFDQHLDRAIRQLQQLQHGGHGTDAIQGIFARIVVGRVALCQQENLLVAGHCRLKGFNGLLAPDEQRDDHVWVDHNIAQGQERQFDGCLHDFSSTAAIWP